MSYYIMISLDYVFNKESNVLKNASQQTKRVIVGEEMDDGRIRKQ